MISLAYFIFAFLMLRFMVSMSNLLTRQWLKKAPASGDSPVPAGRQHQSHSRPLLRANDTSTRTAAPNNYPGPGARYEKPVSRNVSPPLISVLIPVRNEEKNIGNLLNDLSKQDYKNYEILVCDDMSEDHTAQIVCDFMKKDSRIRVVDGSPLPLDWLGKNHACRQLALAAKGEYLLFIDADVRVKPSLITNSLAHVQRYRLDLFSIFPQQVMHTFGEKITVPVMNWALAGLLPLILTRISRRPSFSAANGQFMLFRASVYHSHKFHSELRCEMVEDIKIFRLMKKKGLRTHTVLSNGDISCRMYGSWAEAIEGFSKNVPEYFGGYTAVAIVFALITSLGFIPVLLCLSLTLSLVFIFFLTLHRIIISILSRQSPLQNLILAPLQQLSFCIMIIKAVQNKIQQQLIWKGRNVYEQYSKRKYHDINI